MAAAAAKTANRTAPSSGSTVCVSQEYVPHAHHSAASRSTRAAVLPGLVGCEEAGDLGDGEDEDEVEEQL
jgi:hypothetical protein